MSLNDLAALLGWSTVINSAILLITSLALMGLRDWVSNIHGKLSGLSNEDLNLAYFRYMAHFKLLIIVFNLTPYLALRIMI